MAWNGFYFTHDSASSGCNPYQAESLSSKHIPSSWITFIEAHTETPVFFWRYRSAVLWSVTMKLYVSITWYKIWYIELHTPWGVSRNLEWRSDGTMPSVVIVCNNCLQQEKIGEQRATLLINLIVLDAPENVQKYQNEIQCICTKHVFISQPKK